MNTASARNTGGLTLETQADGEGRRYALPLGEETVDARTVTEQDVRTLLNNAFKKQYRDGSYIPVRVNTPSILIEAAQNLGKTIDDLPIILNVGKARQMMSSPREWALEQKKGTAHDFSDDDDVIALIRAMDKPKYIIFQTADERYVEVLEFETAKKQKAVAVLEIGENKNPEYLNGYNGGFYQVLVTAFEPDTGYVETLLNKDGNIQIYPKKKKGSSQRGSGNRVPSHLNESPFANSIPDSATKSNPSTKISSGRRFVFLEGTKKRNTITRVIRFDVDTEMDMEDIGDYVISNNTFGDKTFRIFEELGIATEYERRNAPSFAEYISKKRNGSEGEGRGKISSDSRVGDQRRGAPEGAGGNGSGGVNGTRQALPRRR